jgi:hypothetical protein
MELLTVFLLVIYYIHRWKYRLNEASKKNFGAFCLSINTSVKLLPTDHKLLTRFFPMDYFCS